MYILNSGCGWIPAAPIKFVSNLIDIIKILTPVVLVIMGSLNFGKAVMAQNDDQIKKAQSGFIKKVIAGAAVFFVIVFIKWIAGILDKANVSGTDNAFSCLNALVNGTYVANDDSYYTPPEATTNNKNDDSTNSPQDNPLNYKSEQELYNIITTCEDFNSSTNNGLTCISARNKFCESNFNTSTDCYNKCSQYNFSTGDPTVAFAITAVDGCSITNINELAGKKEEPVTTEDNKNEELNEENCHERLEYLYNSVCKSPTDLPYKTSRDLADLYADNYPNDDKLYNELWDNGANLENSSGNIDCQILYNEVASTTDSKYICSNALNN